MTLQTQGNQNDLASDRTEDADELSSDMVNTLSDWIKSLCDPSAREQALIILGKKRELIPDLAVMLWYSFGSVSALLDEIVCVYPSIMPPTLSAAQSNRVCNALALLQCIASHPDTRHDFMQARIPLFLYPFLHTSCKTRPFEYLRLTSLGVIGALVKTDEREVISFLINTEIIPLCLRIMEHGSELSKTVATFILQKVLADDTGLQYICHTYERFSHVAMILGRMVLTLSKEPSSRLLKHVIRCYLRLSENLRAREALRSCLPDSLKNLTFSQCLSGEPQTRRWLQQLLQNLETNPIQQAAVSNHLANQLSLYQRQLLNSKSVTHTMPTAFANCSGDFNQRPGPQSISNRGMSPVSSMSSNPYGNMQSPYNMQHQNPTIYHHNNSNAAATNQISPAAQANIHSRNVNGNDMGQHGSSLISSGISMNTGGAAASHLSGIPPSQMH